MQRCCKGAGKVDVSHGFGRNHVEGADCLFVGEHMKDRLKEILKRDPAGPLLAASQLAAKPRAKQRQHLPERAAERGKHHAETQVRHADTGGGCRRCRFLPGLAYLAQEPGTGSGLLGEHLVGARAIKACGRG